MHLLEEVRLAIGHPEAFPVERRRVGLEAEGLGDVRCRRLRSRRHEPGRWVEAAALHLLGEGHLPGEVEVDAWRQHERALAARPLDPLLADELVERTPHGDQAAAIAG